MEILKIKDKNTGQWISIPALKGEKGDIGAQGEQGPAGKDGSDATVTTENITNALGFTPANKTVVDTLCDEMTNIKAEIGGTNVKVEVVSDNLIASWVDGKYAQAKEYFIDYAKMSYGTADISGYEYIIVTPYTEPNSVSFPFVLYSADGSTQFTGNYENFKQLTDGSYKVKIPVTNPAITGIRLNILTENKVNSFVKGVKTENQNVKGSIYKYTDSLDKPFDFSGKTAIAFGDSISAGVSSPSFELVDSFVELFAEKVDLSLVNASVSGSCISDTNDNSIYNTIIRFTTQKDFIFVCGGTNDFNTSKPLGVYGDTTPDTFYGALKSICEHFKTNFANSKIIFITPIPYTATSRYYNIINIVGCNLNDYRNAIYEIATTYGYNVVDGSNLGMPEGQGGWSNYMCADSDGCHPTAEGHKLYARNLAAKMIGAKGADGKTPAVGIDYFTESDKAQIVQSVIDSLGGTPVFGYVDENNNIIISSKLADETYTVKYELEDGTTIDIGNLVLEEEVEIVNQIPLSTDTDGTVYNGIGYKTDTRINSSGNAVDATGVSVTGFIPVKTGDKIYMKGMYVNETSGYTRIAIYDTNKSIVNLNIYPASYINEGNDVYSYTISDTGAAYVRLSAKKTMDGTEIITVNQPIV